MAGIDDLATIQKNGVVGVNALVQALEAFRSIYGSFVGLSTTNGIASDEFIVGGSGRLVNVSVITSAVGGIIHDAADVASASNDNAIYVIPDAVGIVNVNFPFFNGLVVKPAANSIVSISYSGDST